MKFNTRQVKHHHSLINVHGLPLSWHSCFIKKFFIEVYLVNYTIMYWVSKILKRTNTCSNKIQVEKTLFCKPLSCSHMEFFYSSIYRCWIYDIVNYLSRGQNSTRYGHFYMMVHVALREQICNKNLHFNLRNLLF